MLAHEQHLAHLPIQALPLTFPSLEYRPDLVDAATNCTRTELKHPSDPWILVTTHAAVMHTLSRHSSPLLSQPSTLPGSVTTPLFQLRSEVSTSANAGPGISSRRTASGCASRRYSKSTEHATSDPALTQRTHTTGRHIARTKELVVIGVEGTAGRVPIADEARGRLPSLDGALASGLPVGGRRRAAVAAVQPAVVGGRPRVDSIIESVGTEAGVRDGATPVQGVEGGSVDHMIEHCVLWLA